MRREAEMKKESETKIFREGGRGQTFHHPRTSSSEHEYMPVKYCSSSMLIEVVAGGVADVEEVIDFEKNDVDDCRAAGAGWGAAEAWLGCE